MFINRQLTLQREHNLPNPPVKEDQPVYPSLNIDIAPVPPPPVLYDTLSLIREQHRVTTVQYPTLVESQPSNGPVIGNAPRPFLPEQLYLATTVPTRDPLELCAFINHCAYLLQNWSHYIISHPLTELHSLTPHPIIFSGFLWHYRITINRTGVLEDYCLIVCTNSTPEQATLDRFCTVFFGWDADGFSFHFSSWVCGKQP